LAHLVAKAATTIELLVGAQEGRGLLRAVMTGHAALLANHGARVQQLALLDLPVLQALVRLVGHGVATLGILVLGLDGVQRFDLERRGGVVGVEHRASGHPVLRPAATRQEHVSHLALDEHRVLPVVHLHAGQRFHLGRALAGGTALQHAAVSILTGIHRARQERARNGRRSTHRAGVQATVLRGPAAHGLGHVGHGAAFADGVRHHGRFEDGFATQDRRPTHGCRQHQNRPRPRSLHNLTS